MSIPFIFLSKPDEDHYIELWQDDNPILVREKGTHAVFVAKVPFIPAFMTSDFTRIPTGSEHSRIAMITRRQIRFVSDLLSARALAEDAVSFDLRFLVTPEAYGKQSKIEVIYLGKVFHADRITAQNRCQQLWQKFIGHFPQEDPFNYPLEPLSEVQILDYLEPITRKEGLNQLREICKYEDVDPLIGSTSTATGYFPHPWSPSFDATALGRFIETLAQQPERSVVSVCLRPTTLSLEELQKINLMLAQYWELLSKKELLSWLKNYRQERYEDMQRTFRPLINSRNHLFKVKIQIIGEQLAPIDVIDALGSELIENSLTDEPRRWASIIPRSEEEKEIAWHNFRFLEHRPWGADKLEASARRFRHLVSAYEAAGAFRLPIPPERGYLPGLEVRDEPFVLPRVQLTDAGKAVILGEILHRGQPSGLHYEIPVRELTQHTLIGGFTGTGKTNTCLHLLSQLWKKHRIPFLVIYPIDKPDYRILFADPEIRDDLLFFTLGDENTVPFRFNPFAVADGVLLRTHISLLMRCFSAAFWLWDPLPAIYRESLRSVYVQCGWDIERGVGGAADLRIPTMADFYSTLVEVSQEMTKDYGSEVKGNIRQGSEIRIRDLLSNIGMVINASKPAPIAEVLTRPTIMELGRIGSSEDTALVMGFLLMLLSEQLQSNMRRLTREQRTEHIHITLIEEAHRLMQDEQATQTDYAANPRAQGGEDFSYLLAEVRGLGEGFMMAEQIPTKLVKGAIGNSSQKIMHRLEDPASFELFCELMNLDERQRVYARTLKRGDAIVRDLFGNPVRVRVANYMDQFQDDADYTLADDSDEAVRRMMYNRLIIPDAQIWRSDPLERYYDVPARAKVFSVPYTALIGIEEQIGSAASNQDWMGVRNICVIRLKEYNLPADPLTARCLLARVAARRQTTGSHAGKRIYEAFPACRAALENFPLD